jgi:hypothetical protein
MSIGLFVEASTQSDPLLRHGKISAYTAPFSITQTSRSLSVGAIETGSHFSGSECTEAIVIDKHRSQ